MSSTNKGEVNFNNYADAADDAGTEDYLYEDILGGTFEENEDDLGDYHHLSNTANRCLDSNLSKQSGSACGNESCAAVLSYLKTTISDRDETISKLEADLDLMKSTHAGEIHKLKSENEKLAKQFSVAKSQAVKLRNELRDWLRLPLNQAFVTLKKAAKLKTVSEIIDLVPALGAAAEVSIEYQHELAEVEQRLKAYNSMVNAKNDNASNEESSSDSLSLASSLGGKGGEISDTMHIVDGENKPVIAEPGEIEEGEVATSGDESSQKHSKKKKKKHHSEHGKKKHHKEKKDREKDKDKDKKMTDKQSSVVPAGNNSQQQQQSNEWVDLLRKHVAGNWPKKASSEGPNRNPTPDVEKKLGSQSLKRNDDEGASRRHDNHLKRSESLHSDAPSPVSSSNSAVLVESKLSIPNKTSSSTSRRDNETSRKENRRRDDWKQSARKELPKSSKDLVPIRRKRSRSPSPKRNSSRDRSSKSTKSSKDYRRDRDSRHRERSASRHRRH